MATHPNQQAFPSGCYEDERHVSHNDVPGLTKREEFAKAAMMGMHAGGRIFSNEVAKLAVQEADALIAELNKEVKK